LYVCFIFFFFFEKHLLFWCRKIITQVELYSFVEFILISYALWLVLMPKLLVELAELNLFLYPATNVFESIRELHDAIMYIMLVILGVVITFIFGILNFFLFKVKMVTYPTFYSRNKTIIWDELFGATVAGQQRRTFTVLLRKSFVRLRNVTHGERLEFLWTIIPSIILIFIAVPSFAMLYAMDELSEGMLTLKVIGYQWYWSYEYVDLWEGLYSFDSYMVTEDSLLDEDMRLLSVDNQVWLPVDTNIRILVTAADVLHCWTVPMFGIKIDCVPGRINQACLHPKITGIFYGQCSELCGVNHGFMPIAVKVVPQTTFSSWVDFVFKG